MNTHTSVDAYESDDEITIRIIRPAWHEPLPIYRKDIIASLIAIVCIYTTLGYLIVE
jgi:hypothetical protein